MRTLGGCILCILSACALAGCGRTLANDPMADAEAAGKIRGTLVSASSATGAAETQAAAKATGWGTIKGRFVYDGPPPAAKRLNVDKDQEVCGKHNLEDESLVVNSNGGGLANVVLFARNRNIEVHPDYAATADAKVMLDNHNCHFEPHITVVRAGQTLVVKNSDPVSHNTNAGLTNGAFNDSVPANTELIKKLTGAEATPAPVNCTIHPWMKAYVLVQPHPYVAVSAKDGTFELKNVPAGVPVEFQGWHESGTANGAVKADRPDLKWQPNGRFIVKLEPDQVLDLQDIKIAPATLGK